ncbi:hypothetical protein FFM54_07730 [Burkholderia pseudomallei]|nr:hypothetical protein FFM54_07730 [Burkholderia pseudomallei]
MAGHQAMVEDNEFMAFEVGFYWSLHILIRTSRVAHFFRNFHHHLRDDFYPIKFKGIKIH